MLTKYKVFTSELSVTDSLTSTQVHPDGGTTKLRCNLPGSKVKLLRVIFGCGVFVTGITTVTGTLKKHNSELVASTPRISV